MEFLDTTIPSDFEDSGVLNYSSFRKIHHPWLQIAPPISQGLRYNKGPFGLEEHHHLS